MIKRILVLAAIAPIVALMLVSCGSARAPAGGPGPAGSPDPAPGTLPPTPPVTSLAAPPVFKSAIVVGATNVQIANFVLIGTTRISRTVFEYTYKADVTNNGSAAAIINATLTSSAATTTVVDGALDFGTVAQGATQTSADTFTIRQDRSVPFDQNALTWTVQATPPPNGAGLLIEEVLYLPVAGGVPFIELTNFGAVPAPLAQLILMVDTVPIRLDQAATELAPGARLLVLLDGQDRADGLTYHAEPNVVVSGTAGTVTILDKFGGLIDQVAWGTAAGAVNVASGGMKVALPPGSSIGRAPGAKEPRDRQAWVRYAVDQVTPGAVNPPAPVTGLHPMGGSIETRTGALLSWFPAPGATRYHVQVATDAAFSSLVMDVDVDAPPVDISGLAAGPYSWRIRSEFAGGAAAGYSATYTIELTDTATALAGLSVARPRILAATRSAATPSAVIPDKVLAVPLIDQHKDTVMLLLDNSHSDKEPRVNPPRWIAWDPGLKHLWDNDHGKLEEKDPADNSNCVLASLAMINHFFSGNLSQDRIGYQVFKNKGPGPELDLNYGVGLTDDEIDAAYAFALGKSPNHVTIGPNETEAAYLEGLWAGVVGLIDSDIPILAVLPGNPMNHAVVIVGYAMTPDGKRFIVINDPWHARQRVMPVDDFADPPVQSWDYWPVSGTFPAVMQEASVTHDSDGDGVYDFDETERFHTDPNLQDTDLDDVHDKQDIFASVFDPVHGYAFGGSGRDTDLDGIPMELDHDADNGGCDDGKEDTSHDGIYDIPLETWNFDALDDSCQGLAGHLTYSAHASAWDSTMTVWGSQDDTTNIAVRLDPDPNQPGDYIDAGSTYSFRGAHEARYIFPDCELWANSAGNQAGDFTGPTAGLVSGHTVPDGSGRLGVHFVTGIDYQNTQGWGGGCGLPSGSGYAGDSFSAEFRDECWGDPVPGAPPGHKMFNFNCHTPEWDATGSLTVVAP